MTRLPFQRSNAGWIRRASCCVLALALSTSAAGNAHAAPGATEAGDDCVERSEAYAAEAFQAYTDHDYDGAVALYLKAYEAAPSADILFNLARVHDLGLQDLELAISFYQDYLIAPDAEPGRVDIARERIARLEALQRAGRERSAVAAAAPSPVPTDPAAPAASEPMIVNVNWNGAPSASGWTPWRVGALIAGGLGVVGIGWGAGFGLAALSDAATAHKNCDGDVCASRLGINASRSAAQNADVATAGFALGGSLLVAGLALLWVDLENPSERDTLGSSGLHPIATPSELGVSLTGRW